MAEKATEKTLTPAQRRAVAALLTSGNVAGAARAAGVARQTLYKWRQLPHFQKALRKAEAEALRDLAQQMAGLGELAAAALRDALQPDQAIQTRLRAADLVLGKTPAIQEAASVLERLDALEARK